MEVYTISEFTKNVLDQLITLIGGGKGKVEFEINVFNPVSFYDDEEISKKGLCVVLDDHSYGNRPTLKYTVEWGDTPVPE